MAVTRWLVELKGESFDREDFPRWFLDGENFVVRDEDAYYLTGPAFEKFTKATDVCEAAVQVVEFFALASLFVTNLRKPEIGSRVIREEDGKRRNDTVIAAEIRIKARAPQILVGGKPVTPPSLTQAQRLLSASRRIRMALAGRRCLCSQNVVRRVGEEDELAALRIATSLPKRCDIGELHEGMSAIL